MSVLWFLSVLACKDQESTPVDSDTAAQTDLSAGIVPLFNADTTLEGELTFVREDGAIVTRFADRGRDRHAREDEFQSYDHYLPLYWEYRTARVQIVDTLPAGGGSIEISMVSEWQLSVPEFRAWYLGTGTVATYGGNYANSVVTEGPGTYDDDHEKVSDTGTQYRYTLSIDHAITVDGAVVDLAAGQFMELELSQFLQGVPSGRANYYGTAILYEVGVGGLVPWYADLAKRENSEKLDESAWLGGRTTLPYQYSDEPDNPYMQMATNLAPWNGQPFVLGRRVHHSSMVDGGHDESDENPIFTEVVGLAGPLYINESCDACHTRNGRASIVGEGQSLDKWVVKVGTEDGSPDPLIGRVLQSASTSSESEGTIYVEQWLGTDDGLRRPVYGFEGAQPSHFSPRLSPALIGLGLLEALAESTILEWEDPQDQDGDGISGRAQVVTDPETGDLRLGRFGWKAAASSLRHQIASALNTDMGVMTSVMPSPDCGVDQQDCGNETGAELDEESFDNLVRYIALLGVGAQQDIDNAEVQAGQALFSDVGCESCHRATMTTSENHPYSELRSQTIHPYSDLLLHDMGQDMADNLGEGQATGSEWRTTPLWGLGRSACVTGGLEGSAQSEVCVPDANYLHDGRARSLDEAVRWHGGEGDSSRSAYLNLDDDERAAIVRFLESL
ncbi:MAG: CxxC motif-containing protein (DUF1111 family) [Cognaticolwellia sp.]|jgi:CxxC motif-containing protein (DUF1111 family)